MLQETVTRIVENYLGDRILSAVDLVHQGIITSAKKGRFSSNIKVENAVDQFKLEDSSGLISLMDIVTQIFFSDGVIISYAFNNRVDLIITAEVPVDPTDSLSSYLVKLYGQEKDNG